MTLRRLAGKAGLILAASVWLGFGARAELEAATLTPTNTHAAARATSIDAQAELVKGVRAETQATSTGAEVTFSGFQRGKNGEGVVFVHVTERTGLAVKHEGTQVKVRLHGAFIKGRNNLHPLDLSHFNLLIVSSRLVAIDGDVELQLTLRHEAHLDAQWVARADGASSLHVIVPRL